MCGKKVRIRRVDDIRAEADGLYLSRQRHPKTPSLGRGGSLHSEGRHCVVRGELRDFPNFNRSLSERALARVKLLSDKPMKKFCRIVHASILLALLGALPAAFAGTSIVVSVPEQRLALVQNGVRVAQFSVSTSKFGIGDRRGSYATPLGTMEVASKIGASAPLGTVFKSRVRTGEVLSPNAPGRDPIVTRILWLRGLEARNAGAYGRGIYIHGTPVEWMIGRPASYGCIRMRSRDVVRLFDAVPLGTRIDVVNAPIPRAIADAGRGHQLRIGHLAAN